MPADRVSISFEPAALDYVYRALTRCPYVEVAALLADLNAQVQALAAPPLPTLTETPPE